MHTRNIGRIVEQDFILRAMRRGFLVSLPVLETVYDVILDKGGRLIRVQIKKAQVARRVNRYNKERLYCQVHLQWRSHRFNAHGGVKDLFFGYPSNAFDIFALYVEHEKSFYLFPWRDIAHLTHLNISVKLSKFKEKWDF